MNSRMLAWTAFALCGAAAVPVIAQQRDVQITMEVLDDVSDIDAVILALEDERQESDLERAGRDADTTARREAAGDAEREDYRERGIDASAERGSRASDEQLDEREDSVEDRDLKRDIEIDPEPDARENDAPDTRR